MNTNQQSGYEQVKAALDGLIAYVQQQAAENNLCWGLLAKNQVLIKALDAQKALLALIQTHESDGFATEREIQNILESGATMIVEEGSDLCSPAVYVEDVMEVIRPYLRTSEQPQEGKAVWDTDGMDMVEVLCGTPAQPDSAEVMERAAERVFKKLYPLLEWTPGGAAESMSYGVARVALSTLPPTRDESGLAKELEVERDRLFECLETAHGLLVGECPELNMSNYSHDDVAELNAGMIHVFQLIDGEMQRHDKTQPAAQSPEGEAQQMDGCLAAFEEWMAERGIKAERDEDGGSVFKNGLVEARWEGFVCAWGLRQLEREAVIAQPIEDWHEDDGNVLWWNFPVDEPPYAGTPLDDSFPAYKTHWTEIAVPTNDIGAAPAPSPEDEHGKLKEAGVK